MTRFGVFAISTTFTAAMLFGVAAEAATSVSSGESVRMARGVRMSAQQQAQQARNVTRPIDRFTPYGAASPSLAPFGPLGLPVAVVGTGLGVLTGGAFADDAYTYGAYRYGPAYGYEGYAGYPAYTPVTYGAPAADWSEIGQYCSTPVKTCELYSPAQVGSGCSCRIEGGRARGAVTP